MHNRTLPLDARRRSHSNTIRQQQSHLNRTTGITSSNSGSSSGRNSNSHARFRLVVTTWNESSYITKVIVFVTATIVVGLIIQWRTATVNNLTNSAHTNGSHGNDLNQDERTRAIIDFVNQITLTNRLLSYPPTQTAEIAGTKMMLRAEEQALAWIIRDDSLQLSPGSPGDMLRLQQRYALRTLWFQQSNVAPWMQTRGWDPSKHENDECMWYGITCVTVTATHTTSPTSDNKPELPVDHSTSLAFQAVSEIVLVKNNLSGTLPVDLALLSTALTTFHVSYNSLVGTLPSSLGAWTRLQRIILSFNGLVGTLPHSIGEWRDVRVVDFHDNDLGGSLPSSMGHWTAIERVSLPSNRLTGRLPHSIGEPWGQSLEQVNLNRNKFTGTLPLHVLSQWTNLQDFGMADNALEGSIPMAALQAWSQSIRYIGLNHNVALSGSIPDNYCHDADELKAIWVDCPERVSCSCCVGCEDPTAD